MIEFENSKELQKQIPIITEKKLSQLLLVCTCILAAQTTNFSMASKRMSKILGEELTSSTAYARLKCLVLRQIVWNRTTNFSKISNSMAFIRTKKK